MEPDSAMNWIAVCFGATTVGVISWSRFDEPSYDCKSEHFVRYKPRFATSYENYLFAKFGYVGTIVAIYLIFSLMPELMRDHIPVDASSLLSPFAIALGFITLQQLPLLKDLEGHIRGALHSFARIPECVRRTVAKMRSSPLNLTPQAIASQTLKLGVRNGVTNEEQPLVEDELLHTWYFIGCLLTALSERNRCNSGINELFFDYYRDELDSITAKHLALAELIRAHVTYSTQPNPLSAFVNIADRTDSAVFREVRDLRDRLYTFIACGVQSSVKSDAESLECLRKLGFAITPTHLGQGHAIFQLAGLSVMTLVILSVFAGSSTQIFREHVLLPLGSVWNGQLSETTGSSSQLAEYVNSVSAGPFPVPTNILGFYTWSLSTAAFYFVATFGALTVRSARVARREWFDINNLNREMPILRYITPTLVGTSVGCITLLIISFIGGPAFKSSFSELSNLSKAIREALDQSFPWLPLAMVMALISVVLSDSRPSENGFWRAALCRAGCGALAMMLLGFLTSQLSVLNGINEYATVHKLQITDEVKRVGTYVSLFIAAQVGVLAFALCVLIQVSERYTARRRCFGGQYIEAVTRQGPEFEVFFDNTGVAYLFASKKGDAKAASALCLGEWQAFPEGTVVRWNAEPGEGHCKAGNFGLMSLYGNSLIYEGFADQFSGTAQFVAQVRLRKGPATSGAPEPQDRTVELEPAVTAQRLVQGGDA